MKVGFAKRMSAEWREEVAALVKVFPGVEFVMDMDGVLAEPAGIELLVADPLPESFYAKALNLKAVFLPVVGVNHLPVRLLKERGVRVFNCHGNAEAVAQQALTMALAFYGRTIEYHNDLKEGKWHGYWVGKGREDYWSGIWRREAAILGCGAIGRKLAGLLKAFECRVTGFRRDAAAAPPGFDRVCTDLVEATSAAELVFAALPLTPETRGLVSREILLSWKGKFLCNVGRGEVVDEEGLWLALSGGVLKGAAIDTWYLYPETGKAFGEPSRYPMRTLPNLVMAPHVAGSCLDSIAENARQAVGHLASYLRTGDSPSEVDLDRLY